MAKKRGGLKHRVKMTNETQNAAAESHSEKPKRLDPKWLLSRICALDDAEAKARRVLLDARADLLDAYCAWLNNRLGEGTADRWLKTIFADTDVPWKAYLATKRKVSREMMV